MRLLKLYCLVVTEKKNNMEEKQIREMLIKALISNNVYVNTLRQLLAVNAYIGIPADILGDLEFETLGEATRIGMDMTLAFEDQLTQEEKESQIKFKKELQQFIKDWVSNAFPPAASYFDGWGK